MRGRGTQRIGWLVIIVALLTMYPCLASAAYSDRPVKMIVPWAAGGDTDAIKRVVANALEKHLGQPVVVVNSSPPMPRWPTGCS